MTTANTKPVSVQGVEIPSDLLLRLNEILTWRKTGVAELPALNAYVDERLKDLKETGVDTLRIAEDKTLMEAARLLIKIAGSSNE
jgi:hypothetical protein